MGRALLLAVAAVVDEKRVAVLEIVGEPAQQRPQDVVGGRGVQFSVGEDGHRFVSDAGEGSEDARQVLGNAGQRGEFLVRVVRGAEGQRVPSRRRLSHQPATSPSPIAAPDSLAVR